MSTATAVLALAIPAAASASTPATLYQADLSGSVSFKAVEAGTNGNWTTTAAFPLNGTSKNPPESATDTDVWIPAGNVGPSQTVYGLQSPDYSLVASDANSSLMTVGSDVTTTNPWSCLAFKVDNTLFPQLGVTTSGSGAVSLAVDWLGDAYPEGADSNQNGNANNFPMSCQTDVTFGMITPLTMGAGQGTSPFGDGGSPVFGLAWAPGYDTIRFAFSGVNATASSQTLQGSSQSKAASASGQTDSTMSCSDDASDTCTESFPSAAETLTLTKVCSGTVTVQASKLIGTCGSGPTPTAKAPSGSKITKAKISSSKGTAKFSFTATGATGYQCALAAKPKKRHTAPKLTFHSCTSPKSYSHLRKGSYTFEARGVNSAGKDPHPAVKTFKIA